MGFTQEIQLESENYFYLRMFSKKLNVFLLTKDAFPMDHILGVTNFLRLMEKTCPNLHYLSRNNSLYAAE